jgi:hypothetical protein
MVLAERGEKAWEFMQMEMMRKRCMGIRIWEDLEQ